MTNLEVSLRRIIVGYRVIAAIWLAVLGVITWRGDDPPDRAGIILATVLLVFAWSAVTVVVSFRRAEYFQRAWFIVPDIAVALVTLLAPDWAGSANFYGGYPISSVLMAAYATGLTGGAWSVVALTLATYWRVRTGGIDGSATVESSAILVYPFIAVPVIWGTGVLRRSDRLRRVAEAALEAERAERVRAEERSEMAAHLHDSVLQTLALIQRNSENADEVVALARHQERDLRDWLFGDGAVEVLTFETAVTAMCAEVEDTFRFRVDHVVVGNADLDSDLAALVAAGREALVNAAKHSGADSASVYGEILDDRADLYVRDRGVGFAVADIPADREGIATSIRARMKRHGGIAEIRSESGAGTEVALSMPL